MSLFFIFRVLIITSNIFMVLFIEINHEKVIVKEITSCDADGCRVSVRNLAS